MARRKTLSVVKRLRFDGDRGVTEKYAIVGVSGSGKTYTGLKMAEQMYRIGAQFVFIDPVGKAWALRLDANGRDRGLDVPVLGGLHADLPLNHRAGDLVARTVVETNTSAVLDVSLMDEDDAEVFVRDFCRSLFRLRAADPAAMHVFFEEARTWAPEEKANKELTRAIRKLIRIGRNHGIGTTLMDQRPQSVDKNVLNQSEVMIAHRLPGPHEQAAVLRWAKHAGVDVEKMADGLAKLVDGECFLWSQSWLRLSCRTMVLPRETFDASATPKVGKRRKSARKLKPLDVASLRSSMTQFIEEAESNDPVQLKRRIVALARDLAAKPPPAPAPPAERVEVPVLTAEGADLLEQLASDIPRAVGHFDVATTKLQRDMTEQLGAITAKLEQVQAKVRAARGTSPIRVSEAGRASRRPVASPPRAREPDRKPAPGPTPASNGDIRLRAGAVKMLQAIASLRPGPVKRKLVSTLSGISIRSGTFSTYLGELRKLGYAEDSDDGYIVTDAGLDFLGPDRVPDRPHGTDELLAMWSKKFRGGGRRMLHVLVESWPNGVTRAELGERAEVSAKSGTFSTYLGELVKNELAVRDGREIRASDTLFPG